jgi:hypothetical protein
MDEETNSNAETYRGSVVNMDDVIVPVPEAPVQEAIDASVASDAILNAVLDAVANAVADAVVDADGDANGDANGDVVDAPVDQVSEVKVAVVETKASGNVAGPGLAALLPMVPITPPLNQGVVSSRLVHFFCGLVYGEVRDIEFHEHTLFQIIKSTMEIVESHASLSGKEKKELVIEVVRQIVLRKPMDEVLRERCLTLLTDWAVREFIDLVVAASKGHVAVNISSDKRPRGCQPCVIS